MRILALVVTALLLSGCGLGGLFGNGHSNLAPPAKLTHFKARLAVHTVWSHDTGNGTGGYDLDLQPALADGVVYVASEGGRVAAYAAVTGHQLWSHHLAHRITGGVGVGQGLVVVGTRRGRVIALTQAHGAVVWQAQAPSQVWAPPTVAPDAVYVATLDGRVSAFGLRHGRRLWEASHVQPPLQLYRSARPVEKGGVLYEGYANGEVVALRPEDGQRLWTGLIAPPRGGDEIARLVDVGTPIVSGNLVYADSYHGNVTAMSVHSGRILWSHPLSSDRDMALGASTLYVVASDSRVVALSNATGGTVWGQKVLLHRRLGAPALVGPAVVAGDYAGYVQWLSRRTGKLMARYEASDEAIRAAPLVAPVAGRLPYVIVLSTGGKLTALRFKPRGQQGGD
ncbi:MAG: outer membrane protein assembly factor BamB [Gammaproteobacteria bacterium]|nr:outer membrane protein assembly factor BamB [Gammaproteobacteria bacterium]